MDSEKTIIAWQIISGILLVIAILLGLANIDSKRELNRALQFKANLMRWTNKQAEEIISLKEKLKDNG